MGDRRVDVEDGAVTRPPGDDSVLGALMGAVVGLQRDVAGLVQRDQERGHRDAAREAKAARRFRLLITVVPLLVTGGFAVATAWVQSRATAAARAQAGEVAAQSADAGEARDERLIARALAEGRAQRDRELAAAMAAERRRLVEFDRALLVRPRAGEKTE